mgnify:CR=1 FL=1
MLKLVKWAYSLGVRNERHRIAAFLQSAQANRYDRMSAFENELREEPVRSNADAKKRDIQKRAHQKDVDRAVLDIIEALFRADQKYERGASVMFPEGEDK